MPVGLFREEGWVQVDYGTGTTIPVPRSKYEANGYKPDFDKLPSEAEYWAIEKKKEDDSKGGLIGNEDMSRRPLAHIPGRFS
jgi:hypothetical protein